MSDQHQEYPRWLHHPGEQPAILSDDYAGGQRPPMSGYQAPGGRPRMFPPVMVNNEDQEAYYVSRGYEPGQSTKAAFIAAQEAAQLPSGYRQQDYPMMVDGRLVQDPGLPPPVDTNYPKWVDGPKGRELARDAADELRIMAAPDAAPVALAGYSDADEVFLAAIDAAAVVTPGMITKETLVMMETNIQPRFDAVRRNESLGARQTNRWDLVREAKALGIPADRTWTIPMMERAIGDKKHENQAEAARGQSDVREAGSDAEAIDGEPREAPEAAETS